MSVKGASQAKRAFTRMWRMLEEPTVDIIQPVSAWTLPNGVSYDAHHDQFLNALKQVVSVSWVGQPADTMNFVPSEETFEMGLTVTGVTTTTHTNLILLWTAAAETAVRNAWGVNMNGNLYRISQFLIRPSGVSTPIHINLSLKEDD